METLQINVQDKLVAIDNLITALEYLKGNIETRFPDAETISNMILQKINIESIVGARTRSIIETPAYRRNVIEPLLTTGSSDIVRQTAQTYIESTAFRDRVVTYLKRNHVPRVVEEIKADVNASIEKYLESYLLAKLDERIAIAMNRN
jgi:hypothetical protein